MKAIIIIVLFIALCIAVPPIGIAVLALIIIMGIVGAIQQSSKSKKEALELARKQELVSQARKSLHNDWRLLTSVIVKSIKKHWDVLEDKFEQCIDEDDYESKFLDSRFSTEIMYFSHKIVLPIINKLIDDGKLSKNSFALLPSPSLALESLYGIRYEDSDSIAADKYVSGVIQDGRDNLVNDELLSAMYGADPGALVGVENENDDPHKKSKLLELKLGGSLQANGAMKVTHLSGIVFVLFYAMHNSKQQVHKSPHIRDSHMPFMGNDPYKYEEYIKRLLLDGGFRAKRTRGSGDYGVDVVAIKDGITYAIQCKLYNRTVGTRAVQEVVSGCIYYKADFAIVVSDNSFTDAAKRLARKSEVTLTHHRDLLDKIDDLHEKISPTHEELGRKADRIASVGRDRLIENVRSIL